MYFFFFPLKSKFVYLSLFPSTMKAFHRSCLLSKKRFFLSCLSLWTMKKFWNEIDIMASFLLFFTLFFFSSSLPLQFLSTSCQCPSASMTESCTHISLRKWWWWWWRRGRKNRKGRKWRWEEWERRGYPLILFYWSDGFSLMFLLLTLSSIDFFSFFIYPGIFLWFLPHSSPDFLSLFLLPSSPSVCDSIPSDVPSPLLLFQLHLWIPWEKIQMRMIRVIIQSSVSFSLLSRSFFYVICFSFTLFDLKLI